MGKYTQKRKKGIAIIVVLATLMVISVTAVAFVRICNYNRISTNNYLAMVDARLAAYSGVDHALAVIFNELISGKVLTEPVIYPKNSPELDEAVQNGLDISLLRGVLNERFAHSGVVGKRVGDNAVGRYDIDGNFYALKIESEGGKLNLNSHIAAQVEKQSTSDQVLRRILVSLAKRCSINSPENLVALLLNRTIENQQRFFSMEEVEELVFGFPEDKEKLEKFIDNLCTDSLGEFVFGVEEESVRKINEAPNFYKEFRSPVDVNAVSFELLCAIVENIKATAMLYNINTQTNQVDIFNKRLETSISDAPQFFSLKFTDAKVEDIVTSIQDRISIVGGFRSYNEFSSFIDENLITFFPPVPENIQAKDWEKAWRDSLKSNFNPNVVENFWNPNSVSYYRVSKGDLFEINNGVGIPGHTVELSFFNIAPTSITSQGYITANNGNFIVAKSEIKIVANWGKILTHTTQEDFQKGGNFTDTVSLPNNIKKWGQQQADTIAGGLEPAPKIAEGGLFNSGTTFADKDFFVENTNNPHVLKQNTSYFGGDSNQDGTFNSKKSKIASNKLMKIFPIATRQNKDFISQNHLSHEGIVSRRAYYPDKKDSRYFLVHGLSEKSLDATNEDFRQKNTLVKSNVANYEGAIEFWVKLDENPGTDNQPGLTFGLLSCTLKNKVRQGNISIAQQQNPGFTQQTNLQNGKYHEGIQMYLFINSLGKIRLSRLYYAYTFTEDANGVKHYGTTSTNDLDPQRSTNTRRDIEVEVGTGTEKWQAHEWHHLTLKWNDNTGDLELQIDGRTFDKTLNTIASSSGIGVLNEVDPRDSLFINGYTRREAQAGGYFLFDSQIEYPGNATIDRFISHNTPNEGIYNPRYLFTSSYENKFEIPERFVLGPIQWIAYHSAHLLGSNHIEKSSVEIDINENFASNNIDQIAIPQELIVKKQGEQVQYTTNFKVGQNVNRSLECPSLDSISQILFFGYPKIRVLQF